MGYDTPRGENPADFQMRVLQTDDEVEMTKLRTTWDATKRSHLDEAREQERRESEAPDLAVMQKPIIVSKLHQTLVLLERCFVDALKDKDKFLGGLLLKSCIGLLVGVVWLNQSAEFTQSSIFPTTGALFVSTTSSVLDTLFATVMVCAAGPLALHPLINLLALIRILKLMSACMKSLTCSPTDFPHSQGPDA